MPAITAPTRLPRCAVVGLFALLGFGFLPLVTMDAGPALAKETAYSRSTQVKDLLTEDLAGDPSREIRAQLYTIGPGTALPWHIHPDAQEITYIVQGRLNVEIKGKGVTKLKAGDNFYIAPNLVHRGINPSQTEPVKLYVIRIKPKNQPLVKETGH